MWSVTFTVDNNRQLFIALTHEEVSTTGYIGMSIRLRQTLAVLNRDHYQRMSSVPGMGLIKEIESVRVVGGTKSGFALWFPSIPYQSFSTWRIRNRRTYAFDNKHLLAWLPAHNHDCPQLKDIMEAPEWAANNYDMSNQTNRHARLTRSPIVTALDVWDIGASYDDILIPESVMRSTNSDNHDTKRLMIKPFVPMPCRLVRDFTCFDSYGLDPRNWQGLPYVEHIAIDLNPQQMTILLETLENRGIRYPRVKEIIAPKSRVNPGRRFMEALNFFFPRVLCMEFTHAGPELNQLGLEIFGDRWHKLDP